MNIPKRNSNNFFSKSKNVKELTSEDFDPMHSSHLKKKHCCVIMFYAPWCPHCQNMVGIWEEVGKQTAFFKVYAVNCVKQGDLVERINGDSPGFIRSYPTIIVYNKGKPAKKLEDRNVAALVSEVMKACSE